MESFGTELRKVLDDIHTENKQENGKSLDSKSELLTVPGEVREKIYKHLGGLDFQKLRLVCHKLRIESEKFGIFNVYMNYKASDARLGEIPFRKIGTLMLDNYYDLLPWGDAKGDSLENLNCITTSFSTLKRLGKIETVKDATLRHLVFSRSVPELKWPKLHSLTIKYFIPPDYTEAFMLDNLDSLLEQSFPSLHTFFISMSNVTDANLQSNYSLRVARFIAKHWETLKVLNVLFQARPCVPRHYAPPRYLSSTGLQDHELANFLRIQLKSIELNVTELSCPKCILWKMLLQEQVGLESINIYVSCGETLSSNFFCNPKYTDQFTNLHTLSIRLLGNGNYLPFDFKPLASATKLKHFEVSRFSEHRVQVTRPEVLNVYSIPTNITDFTLAGFLIATHDVQRMFNNLHKAENFTLIDCGSGRDIGVTTQHVSDLCEHRAIAYALIDFNTEDSKPKASLRKVKSALEILGDFGYDWRHLYEVGSGQRHRFEFGRCNFEPVQKFFKNFLDEDFDLNYALRMPGMSFGR